MYTPEIRLSTMSEDDDIVFVKEVKRSPLKMELVAENIFDKLTLGTLKFSEYGKVKQLDLSDSSSDEDCDEAHVLDMNSSNDEFAQDNSDHNDSFPAAFNGNLDDHDSEECQVRKLCKQQNMIKGKRINSLEDDVCMVSSTSAGFEGKNQSFDCKKETEAFQQLVDLRWPMSRDNVLKTPKSRKHHLGTQRNHSKAKKPKKDTVQCVSGSPIARAFFSPSSKIKENECEKVGISVPLCVKVNPLRHPSSLQPHSFTNCQIDLLDGLAEDDIFEESYTNTVLSYTSSSVAPPKQVAMHILQKIALSSSASKSRKGILTLQNLMSANTLNHRNLSATWDFVCSTSTDLLAQIEEELEYPNHKQFGNSEIDSLDRRPDFLSVFIFLVNIMEEDFKRYKNNVRESICWKILSPSIFGSSRIKKIAEWLIRALQIIDDHQSGSNVSCVVSNCLVRLKKVVSVLQRLFNLIYQASRCPQETADQMAEMFLGCFFDITSLDCRKRLFSTIEPVVVQRKSVEMVIGTICESTARSSELENQCISLEKITGCLFQKLPPSKSNYSRSSFEESCHTPEEIEEFVFLLYVLCRSYLEEKHDMAMKNTLSLSVMNSAEFCATSEFALSLRDRESMLTIQEDISNLKSRLESHTTVLTKNTLLYLNMMSALFGMASDDTTLF